MSIREFGARVAARRQELGYKSHGSLATVAKVNRSVVFNIENSKVQDIEVETFLKLSKALKWTPDEAVNAYLGRELPIEKLKKEQLYQTTIEFLEKLAELELVELKR